MKAGTKGVRKRFVLPVVLAIVLLCLCLVPVPMSRKDGGTVEYCAVVYRYIVWKELAPEETGEEYLTGTTLDLFPNNFTRRAHAPGYPE